MGGIFPGPTNGGGPLGPIFPGSIGPNLFIFGGKGPGGPNPPLKLSEIYFLLVTNERNNVYQEMFMQCYLLIFLLY